MKGAEKMNRYPRILGGGLAAVLALSLALPAGAQLVRRTIPTDTGIHVYAGDSKLNPTDVNGKEVEVFASEGTTYLPVRALANALNLDIAWDGDTYTVYVDNTATDAKNAQYLQTYFGIAPFSGTVSRAAFDEALTKIGGEKAPGDGALTTQQAVTAAVKAAGMEQLALTYTAPVDAGKAAQRLEAYGVTGVSEQYAPYVAAALDTDIASSTYGFGGELDAAAADALLMAAVNASGRGRNYLGMADDADIYGKLQAAWASFTNYDDAELSQLGTQLVLQGASTGYGLKYDGYDARFLPEYTLQYGHSDITHAVQLIGLLNSENLEAKVQLEPKVSIYEYMTDWGDPTKIPATPTYELKEVEGGRWLCYAMEYDLQLEFNTPEDKETFHGIVEDYAKKYDDRVDEEGVPTVPLLSGSWWQPLYVSTLPMDAELGFQLLKDNVIRDGAYTIHPFSLPDGGDKIADVVAKEAPDLAVEQQDIYVNPAFYHYIAGTDYQ